MRMLAMCLARQVARRVAEHPSRNQILIVYIYQLTKFNLALHEYCIVTDSPLLCQM